MDRTPNERNVGPLLTVWAAALLFAAALYWLQMTVPAFDEVIIPIYIVIAIVVLWATVRWLRDRRRIRAHRHGDRRLNGPSSPG